MNAYGKGNALWVWYLWIIGFFAVWLWLVIGQGLWSDAKANAPMAVAMSLGSYLAGSTPMGGGTVGFPVLVLLFDMPATLGRDFSFAIQSIGMVSASIFILARRQPLAVPMLKGAMVGILFGVPLGLAVVAPIFPELWIKIVFAVLWGSFGVLHLYRVHDIARQTGMTELGSTWNRNAGLVMGTLAGATVVSVTGVGIDMVIYTALVLLCRADLKIAIPTSVVIMAFASLVGVAAKSATTGLQPGVFENWLAAAPVVALGAPLGVFVVGLIGRKPTLLIVSALCVGQFVWTCYVERQTLGLSGVMISLLALAGCLVLFEILWAWGRRLARLSHKTSMAQTPPAPARYPSRSAA